jgi:hypothetical protein
MNKNDIEFMPMFKQPPQGECDVDETNTESSSFCSVENFVRILEEV